MKTRIAIISGVLLTLASLGTAVQAAPGDRFDGNQARQGKTPQHQQSNRQVQHKQVQHRSVQKRVVVKQVKRGKPVAQKRFNKKHRVLVTKKPAFNKHAKRYNTKYQQRRFYRVKSGDNLYRIANRTGVNVNRLIRLNRGKISARNGYRLHVGQVISLSFR